MYCGVIYEEPANALEKRPYTLLTSLFSAPTEKGVGGKLAMPPKRKKAATDKAAAKPAMSKKVKVKKEAPKSGVALEAGSWTLSGGLAKLPLELLHHVFYFLITATGRESCHEPLFLSIVG